jgi:LysR family transcriptional regulator, glycine cleavage system transcriptional activator
VRRLPPLNAVRAFEAAARHLSFNQAAEELHVTPSAVSHQVKSLEDFLGSRLFRRAGRRVSLTRDGEGYLPAIRSALDQIDDATRRIAQHDGDAILSLSLSHTFASEWLVPRLKAFKRLFPDLELRITTQTSVPDFDQADIDVAVHRGSGDWPGLETHRVLTEELLPVCSPALLEGPTPLRHPEDLRQATLLHVMPRIEQWRDWLEAAGVPDLDPERGPKFPHTALALEAAATGLGVVVSSRLLAAPYLEDGRLVIPFDVDVPARRAYYLGYRRDRARDPKITAFRDWVLAVTQGDRESDAEAPSVSRRRAGSRDAGLAE